MKVYTPEISWHRREPIFSVDIQNKIHFIESEGNFYRIVTCGADNSIVIWRIKLNNIISNNFNQNSLNLLFSNSTSNKNSKKQVDLNAVCVLNMHIKTVNVVRFGPISNILASGADDSYVYIYKLVNEQITDSNIDDEELICVEKWKRTITLRKHVEDVVDLAWSLDEKYLITGSVDNSCFIWNISKSEVLHSLTGHNGYIQGVAWDPLNNYIVTLCSDRNLRIFDSKKKIIGKIDKLQLNNDNAENTLKSTFLFHDERLVTCSRRLSFSPNGELLIASSGIIEINEEAFQNAVHLFVRNNIKKLHCYFPTDDFSTSVKFCSKMFKLKQNVKNPYPFPYRLIFAIATKKSIFIYDTQQPYPIAEISNIHYTKLSDISWSHDAKILIVSSTDGYCTLIFFDQDELGEFYEDEPYKFEIENIKISSTSVKKLKKEEQTITENIVKNSNLKITNFFKKITSMPLQLVKLENDKKKENHEKMDIVIINDLSDIMIQQSNKLENNYSKTKSLNNETNINILKVKRKPKIDLKVSENQLISSTLTSLNLNKPQDHLSEIKLIENQDQSMRLKRKPETDLETDKEYKKKNIKLNSFQQTNEIVKNQSEIFS